MAFTTCTTVSVGMAKPMPSTPDAAEIIFMFVMPMTCPLSFISGPPELPSFIAALVWSRRMVLP